MNFDELEYPYKGKSLAIHGHTMNVIVEGSGQPIVMVHGNPTWSFYYRRLINYFKNSYQVVVPDHIGCGLSHKPTQSMYNYTLSQRVDDMIEMHKQLKLGNEISLVVHDWGGMIGLAYAMKMGLTINELIIFNTAGFHLPESKKFPFGLWLTRTWLGACLVLGFNAFSYTASIIGFKQKVSKQIMKAYRYPYNNWKNRIATLKFVQDIPLKKNDQAYDIVSKVESWLPTLHDVPTTIFWGLQDFVFDVHFLNKWKEILPNASIYEYKDAGHYILEDKAQDILEHLAKMKIETP